MAVDSSSGSRNGGAATGKKPVAGTVVFGTGNRLLDRQLAAAATKQGGTPPKQPEKEKEADKDKEDEQKSGFQAFSGKPRTLKG